jgi:hypothetical protein
MTLSQYYIEVWRDQQQMPVIGIEEYHLSHIFFPLHDAILFQGQGKSQAQVCN